MSQVVILGAHTSVGRSLRSLLGDRDIPFIAATTSDHIEDDLVLIDEAVLKQGGLFVLAMKSDLTRRVADAVAQGGRPVIDMVGAFDAPFIWPTLHGPQLDAPQTSIVRVCEGPAAPLAAVIAALAAFGPRAVQVTTLESASARGQPGIDELSEQSRAVFALRDVDPEQFPASLAFDPIPSLAEGEAHPHDADADLVQQMQAALRAVDRSIDDLTVTRILVPTFYADAATVMVATEDSAPEASAVIDALRAARGLRYVDRAVVPSLDAVDRDDVLVSRVRVGPRRLDLWLAYDRMRAGSAVAAALAIDAWHQANGAAP
ncbi:MAG: Asd/ArgC dimerization domain-containing protein [Myxococcota bacterium]